MDGQRDTDREGDLEESRTSRERLLDAAIHLAGRYGMKSVTYRSVASHAGVAHGLVRHHFGSRSGLLAEALERASSVDAVETQISAPTIAEFATTFVPEISEHWDRALLQFDSAIAAIRGQADMQQITRDYDRYLRGVSETLRAAGIRDEDGSLAALVFAALDGLTIQHLVYGSADRTELALSSLRSLLARLVVTD